MTPAGSASPTSQPPSPTATAPAAMNAPAVSAVTPPVGTTGMSGNGPRSSRMNAGPTCRGREELDRGGAGPPGREDLGRGRRAGERRDAASGGPGDEFDVGVRHHEERRAGLDRVPRRRDREHRPGADRHPGAGREPARDRLDGRQGVTYGLVQGDLERSDAAAGEGARHVRGVVGSRRRAIATTPPAIRPAGIAGRVVETVTRSDPPSMAAACQRTA